MSLIISKVLRENVRVFFWSILYCYPAWIEEEEEEEETFLIGAHKSPMCTHVYSYECVADADAAAIGDTYVVRVGLNNMLGACIKNLKMQLLLFPPPLPSPTPLFLPFLVVYNKCSSS